MFSSHENIPQFCCYMYGIKSVPSCRFNLSLSHLNEGLTSPGPGFSKYLNMVTYILKFKFPYRKTLVSFTFISIHLC